MNAAFLIMSSAALAGADPAPAAPAAPAAPIVVSGTGCTNCGAPAYTSGCCGSKPSILDKIKSKIGSRSHGCGCAPVADPCNTCNPCSTASSRPNLLDNLKAKWASKKHCGPSCDPCGTAVTGCASPLPPGAAPAAPPSTGTTAPPKEMPKETPKAKTGGNVSSIPQPLPPVTGAGLTGTSPY